MIKYYMVGGCVRDKLMGKVPHDFDFVVVGASEQEMKALYGESVGEGFPVYLGKVPGKKELGKVEIAMARTEVKSGEGHKGFTFKFDKDVTLEQDLQRRDFTVNAMAMDIETGEITDPYGGQEDLKNKVIRSTNPQAFVEDPLRVLRMARFAAKLGFEIEKETLELSKKININSLTEERMLAEIIKSLESDHAEVFFRVLLSTGHLVHFFPELQKLVEVEQAHHEEDAFEHIMQTLKEANTRSLAAREKFALLLHDLGKGETPKEELPKHHGHEDRSFEIAKIICKRWKVSDNYKRLALWFAKNHMRLHTVDLMSPGKLITFTDTILKNNFDIETIIDMSECDSKGRYEVDWDKLRNAVKVIKETRVDDIIGRGFQGAQVGLLLHEKRVKGLKELNINN